MPNVPARSRFMRVWLALVGAGCLAGVCFAEPPGPAQTDAQPILEWDQLTGDWVGMRPMLSDHGVEFFANYTLDAWGNVSGRRKQGSTHASTINYSSVYGDLNFGAQVDLEKAVGWQGASMSTTWVWLYGWNTNEEALNPDGKYLGVSNIAGFNTLRLFTLWFQQKLWDDKISIRVGQLAADAEFFRSTYGGVLISDTFTWPAIVGLNLPNKGQAFPMGTLGARVAWNPVDWFTFQSAVFQGNVFAQNVNRFGFLWRLDAQTGYTFFNEAQFRWNQRGGETGLPGQLKPGLWFQTGQSADPLASSTSSGNGGFYIVLDQMLYREPANPSPACHAPDGKSAANGKGAKTFETPALPTKSDQGLGWFARAGFTPPDRNFLDFYFDTGLTYKGLIPGRDNDTMSIGFAYGHLSNGARSSLRSQDINPTDSEMVVELTYQAPVTRWLIVQPDLQYFINPGANSELTNALVIEARATVIF
ncbi:MAG: carbohydrate porin [Verrucomicrobiota bacterium]